LTWRNILPCLAYIETPNGEDEAKMREYQSIFPEMYADIGGLDIADGEEMWKKFGVGDEIAAKMRETAEAYTQDESVMRHVRNLYEAMLSTGNAHFRG